MGVSFLSSSLSLFFFIEINSEPLVRASGVFQGWSSDFAKATKRTPVLTNMAVDIQKTFCHCCTVCCRFNRKYVSRECWNCGYVLVGELSHYCGGEETDQSHYRVDDAQDNA
jgi:hypothetical protein